MENNLLIGLLLTTLAGLSTGIGSTIAFFSNKSNERFLSLSLGFSAGVMIYMSFAELFTDSLNSLSGMFGARGILISVVSFFVGVVLVALINSFIPRFENPHEFRKVEELKNLKNAKKFRKLYHLGTMTALIIAIHNFPEGIATLIASLKEIYVGVSVAIAIALHNIPEGIAISVPIYYATGDKKKAFFWSFLSGLTEPLGAFLGYIFLSNIFNQITFDILFAMTAGIMVYVSFAELIPSARKYGKTSSSFAGIISGMFVMAISLFLLG